MRGKQQQNNSVALVACLAGCLLMVGCCSSLELEALDMMVYNISQQTRRNGDDPPPPPPSERMKPSQIIQTLFHVSAVKQRTDEDDEDDKWLSKQDMQNILSAVRRRQAMDYEAKSRLARKPMPLCPVNPKGGESKIKYLLAKSVMGKELEPPNPAPVDGGHIPTDCRPRDRVAIVVTMRDREDQLKQLLQYLHPFLIRQKIEYKIYVVTQADEQTFNKGMLYNAGYLEALKDEYWDCFVFHDVDLLPEDPRNIYNCPKEPRHMSVAVDTLGYKLPYYTIYGGVVAMSTEDYAAINGFSNQFWGWGGEDDDFGNRVVARDFRITRYSPDIARYTMMQHSHDRINEDRCELLLIGSYFYDTDGLNNFQYTSLGNERYDDHILVKVTFDELRPSNIDVLKNFTRSTFIEREQEMQAKGLNTCNLSEASAKMRLKIIYNIWKSVQKHTFSKTSWHVFTEEDQKVM